MKLKVIDRCLLHRDHWTLGEIKLTVLNSACFALFLSSMIARLDGLLLFSQATERAGILNPRIISGPGGTI